MTTIVFPNICQSFRYLKVSILGILLAIVPAVSVADIVWDGRFPEKTWYPAYNALNEDWVAFFHTQPYGRPPQTFDNKIHPIHIGNGETLSLESSPTRGSNYSMKFTVKNSANGSESRDCDPATNCANRRSNMQMTSAFTENGVLPYHTERWLSFSIYLPSDFDGSGSGWGPVIWGSKSSLEDKPGMFGLMAQNNKWKLIHRYYDEQMHNNNVDALSSWWLTAEYTPSFPSSTNWPQGLVDFPDEAKSKAALANLNKGGWTDFIWHWKTDVRKYEDNDGFLDVYMRAGAGPWTQVLAIRPMKDMARSPSWPETDPQRVYDRGIGQYGPKGNISTMGLYMDKGRVWNDPHDMVINVDNYKAGDANTTFEMMTHDGSSFDDSPGTNNSRPMPPNIHTAD